MQVKNRGSKSRLGACRRAIFLRSKHPAAAPRFTLQILARRKSGLRVFRCNRLPELRIICMFLGEINYRKSFLHAKSQVANYLF
ncbi:MAG TPA: hypothetical protein PLJ00_17275 [Chitinophagales bacterium]|nr:hypothetical protein [Chitinophagales bacterium]HRH54511.1 hypothetical protein [Chitinophagales bacterium]